MTQNLILGAGILTWILLIVVLVFLALKKEKYDDGICNEECTDINGLDTNCLTLCRSGGGDFGDFPGL